MVRFEQWKSKRPRNARRSLTLERLGAGPAARVLRLERMEPRVLLAHTAPELNPADSPHFAAITENMPIASNTGEQVSTLLQSGGTIINTYQSPLPSNDFA